jgi:hypothetical protein
MGPVVHSASGNMGIFTEGKSVTFAFTARQYVDGSCDGQWQVYNHSQDPAWGKWHGRVMSLRVYDDPSGGKKAVIGGIETISPLQGFYDAFVAMDNGEGAKASGPNMWCSSVFWDPDLTLAQQVWEMPPEEVVQLIADRNGEDPAEIWRPIEHGNISIK